LQPTIGSESLHRDSNDNAVRIVKFDASKNLVVKSTMFPHRNIRKCTWTLAGEKTHNQIYHILIDRRWHSSVLDVPSLRGFNCDTDHYLLVAELGERLAVSKQESQKSDVERFNLRKLNELEVRIKASNRFVVLENVSDSKDINWAWENTKEAIKTSAKQSLGLYELKLHKPRFAVEYLRFLDQRKQAKMQWVQDPKQRNVVKLNNIKREVSRHLRSKGRNISKLKLINLKLTVRSHISNICIGASMILRRVTSPEII